MRELDLLPRWYVDMLRRRNLLRFQAGLAAFGLLIMISWTLINAQQIGSSRLILDRKNAELVVAEQRVRQRTVQQQLRDQLRTQDRVESSLGLDVESSRILDLVSHALPDSASLIELTIDTDEHARPLLQRVVSTSAATVAVPDRRLQVSIKCVAPANIDVATLLENLTNSGICQNLRLDYAKEKVADNAIMREFQIAFQINLNCDGGMQ